MSRVFLLSVLLVAFGAGQVLACGACGSTLHNLGKGAAAVESKDGRWYFEYLFDQVNWDRMDAREAHNLHHSGHEFHDKTTEDFHHFKLGAHVTEDLDVFVDFPYVIRRSLEVESHADLGKKQTSQGPGDMQLIGTYRFWKSNDQSLSAVAGMQLPTGSTHELTTRGDRFEPELQPGSGAYDYIVGGVYRLDAGRLGLTANATYVFTTRGAQGFEAGDSFTLSLAPDYLLNPGSKCMQVRAGMDMLFQNEDKDEADKAADADSGGQTVLAGPVFKLQANKHVAFTGTLLFPVYQNLGGVHQQMDYEWMMGAQVSW